MLADTLDSFSILVVPNQAALYGVQIPTPYTSIPSFIPAFTFLSGKHQALAQAAVSPSLDFFDAPSSSLLELGP